MVSGKVKINNPTGLHLRPAGVFCTEALKYESDISFCIGTVQASAKSILGILAAGVKAGDEIEIICSGDDEEKALNAMIEIVESGLGE